MRKVICDKVTTKKKNVNILDKYIKELRLASLEEFNIYNLSDAPIHIQINGGNFFELEAGEGFSTSIRVYKCIVKEKGAVIKFSGVE